jgi:hypothetical protein
VTTFYSWPLHSYLVSTATSSLPLLDSGFQRQTFLFLRIPELFPASATNFPQQQLTTTEQLTNRLTDCNKESKLKPKLELLYDWRFTANQFILATSLLRPTKSNCCLQLNTCGCSPYAIYSQTRGRFFVFGWQPNCSIRCSPLSSRRTVSRTLLVYWRPVRKKYEIQIQMEFKAGAAQRRGGLRVLLQVRSLKWYRTKKTSLQRMWCKVVKWIIVITRSEVQ